VGDEVDVKVIEIDHQRHRIGLSRKALLPGPWQTISDELKAGDYVEGVITRLVEFGAFVKLPQGIEGLIHTSQIGYSSHQVPQNAVKSGDKVLLKVLEVKPDRKRIALSMRQVPIERQIAWSMDSLDQDAVSSEPTVEPETTTLSSPQ
jgi:small subunit ribosomal protein S1